MTDDQKKEAISKELLRILACGQGFKVLEPGPDHGVDLIVYPVTTRIEPSGRTRYLDSPFKLDLQLKATTANGIIDDGDNIKFDLEVKNYNDLIQRRSELLPLHLVVVVLEAPPPACIGMDEVSLRLGAHAYWYMPHEDAIITENEATIRIKIPKANLLKPSFFRDRYEQLGIEL
jgi:hypothetical protein